MSYDANGNLLSGLGRSISWTDDNLPASVTSGGKTETYTYDADGERLTRTVPGGTVDTLLSQGKAATASTTQTGNEAAKANDGLAGTRWSASSGTYPQWWQVDLGASYPLTKLVTDWHTSSTSPRSYKYKVEVSSDNTTWTTVVDKTGNTTPDTTSDSFTATARYVRVTVTGATTGWASAKEFRVYGTKQAPDVTTVYLGGVYEEDVQTGEKRMHYQFNGQVIAQRTNAGSRDELIYLYGDHLGSVSAATTENGALLSRQNYDPWGAVRGSATISQTTLNYTGQRRDSTGLLYYHARYYDPVLGRFLSADSIVPDTAHTSLTVDFHEPGFVSGLNGESRLPFWFQMSGQQRQEATAPWGPANVQALNRYSYVNNNPLKYTDPTGHSLCDRFLDRTTCVLMRIGKFFIDQVAIKVAQKLCPSCETRRAEEAFANGEPIEVKGPLGEWSLDPTRLFGNNLKGIHQIRTGDLRGYGRGTSDATGGRTAAEDLFERLTGRRPTSELDTVVTGSGRTVTFRGDSKTGVPKVEIVDHVTKFLEKIAFHP